MARSGGVIPALLFLATAGASVSRRRNTTPARRARELLADLRARCEARGGACDCGMHRPYPEATR